MENYDSTTQRLSPHDPHVCALVQDLLPLYIEGEVSTGSRDFIVEHLAQCERCAGFLAGAQSVRGQFQREHQQRAAAAERERLNTSLDPDTNTVNLVVQVFGAICLAALVALLVPGILRNVLGMHFWFGPFFGGISLSSLWLLTGLGVLGAVAVALLRRDAISPEWKLALAITAIGVGAIGLGWKFITYMAAVSAGISGFILSPYLLLGGLLVLAGATSLWQARDEFGHMRVLPLLKRAGALLLASVVAFVVMSVVVSARSAVGMAPPAMVVEAVQATPTVDLESAAPPMEAAPAFVLEATPTVEAAPPPPAKLP